MQESGSILKNILSKTNLSFISSIDNSGYPKTRAMLLPCEREGETVFIYHTNTSSAKVSQYRSNPKACIYFCVPEAFLGIVLTGTMEVLEDRASKTKYWKKEYALYYPKGVSDPDYCILRFTAESGEYYHDFSVEEFSL